MAVAPILPSRDLAATATFYSNLGFEQAGLWPDEYLIVMRDEIGLHFFHSSDALFAEFSRLGLPSGGIPRLHGAPKDSNYGLREFAVVDPDGNLLRIGSFLQR